MARTNPYRPTASLEPGPRRLNLKPVWISLAIVSAVASFTLASLLADVPSVPGIFPLGMKLLGAIQVSFVLAAVNEKAKATELYGQ